MADNQLPPALTETGTETSAMVMGTSSHEYENTPQAEVTVSISYQPLPRKPLSEAGRSDLEPLTLEQRRLSRCRATEFGEDKGERMLSTYPDLDFKRRGAQLLNGFKRFKEIGALVVETLGMLTKHVDCDFDGVAERASLESRASVIRQRVQNLNVKILEMEKDLQEACEGLRLESGQDALQREKKRLAATQDIVSISKRVEDDHARKRRQYFEDAFCSVGCPDTTVSCPVGPIIHEDQVLLRFRNVNKRIRILKRKEADLRKRDEELTQKIESLSREMDACKENIKTLETQSKSVPENFIEYL